MIFNIYNYNFHIYNGNKILVSGRGTIHHHISATAALIIIFLYVKNFLKF